MPKVSTYTPVSEVQDGDKFYLAVDDGASGFTDGTLDGDVAKRQFGAAYSAASDPGVGDDSADGFRVGSLWINSSDGGLFKCTDATVGAAVWVELTTGSGDVAGPASAVDDRIVTFDGTTGKLVQDSGKTVADFVEVTDPVSINAQTGTTYTLVLADLGKLVTLSNAGAITLTVPTNASVAFPVGTIIALQQMGAGAVSVVGATGVTINGTTPGSETLTNAQYLTTATLTKHATDTWTLTGAVT